MMYGRYYIKMLIDRPLTEKMVMELLDNSLAFGLKRLFEDDVPTEHVVERIMETDRQVAYRFTSDTWQGAIGVLRHAQSFELTFESDLNRAMPFRRRQALDESPSETVKVNSNRANVMRAFNISGSWPVAEIMNVYNDKIQPINFVKPGILATLATQWSDDITVDKLSFHNKLEEDLSVILDNAQNAGYIFPAIDRKYFTQSFPIAIPLLTSYGNVELTLLNYNLDFGYHPSVLISDVSANPTNDLKPLWEILNNVTKSFYLEDIIGSIKNS